MKPRMIPIKRCCECPDFDDDGDCLALHEIRGEFSSVISGVNVYKDIHPDCPLPEYKKEDE